MKNVTESVYCDVVMEVMQEVEDLLAHHDLMVPDSDRKDSPNTPDLPQAYLFGETYFHCEDLVYRFFRSHPFVRFRRGFPKMIYNLLLNKGDLIELKDHQEEFVNQLKDFQKNFARRKRK